MKFVSWNVNGIRAAWNHGLSAFLDTMEADIYAFQETRADMPFRPAELEGYHAYWSFCESRKGYSGTLCLSRPAPLRAGYGIGDPGFDTEGRIITLEYEGFIFVNCYIPNSQRSADRQDYRNQWDTRFLRYLGELQGRKPVILCGDFNATLSGTDVYEGNRRAEREGAAFLSTERENLSALMEGGFVDSYRLVHPDEEGKYTWWSNRLFKRKENKGWRLDYFWVSEALEGKVAESTMLTDILGSDHCPLLLEADVSPCKDPAGLAAQELAKAGEACRIAHHAGQEALAKLWDGVDWAEAEKKLADMQMGLAKTAYARNRELMVWWQRRIVSSLEARLLAVRHTCSTGGGPGVDGIRWTEPHEKMSAALSLSAAKYQALPSRLLVIRSKNGKQRRIHVETYYDRAMQCLYAYALDPIAEAWGDRKSFAYRKGRSAFDLNEYVKRGLSGPDAPEWVFIADVRKCYENISHEWILRNIPMAGYVLKQFLKAGYVFGGELFPMDEGVGIGCSISPIIANMALDGLEAYVNARLHRHGEPDYPDGNMVRYADDILFTARTEENARKIRSYAIAFLEERGLMLSHEKSRIVRVDKGFTFLSRTYYKSGTQLLARPSDSSIERFMANIRDTVKGYTGSQQSLIEKLNRKIDGWATYHKTDEAETAFRKMDVYIDALLLELCESKHPKWSREKILRKYWYVDGEGRHCYALPGKKEVRVKFLSDTLLINHSPVRTCVNPYLDIGYMERRTGEKSLHNVIGIYRAIWERQGGRCLYCGHPIARDEEKALVKAYPEKRRFASRMAYVHNRCLPGTLDYIDAASLPSSLDDLNDLLSKLETGRMPSGQKFHRLYEFFRTSGQDSVRLAFKEIEEIMGEALGAGARNKQFWQRTGFMCISQCWLGNGYAIKELRPEEGYIVFGLATRARETGGLDIPDAIRHGPLPADAKHELENYFQYIIKKYGL